MPSRSQLPAEIVFFVRTSTAEPLLLPPAHVLLPRSPKDMMRTLPPRLQQRDADHSRAAREWKREAKRLRRDNERVRGEKTKLVHRFARQEQTQARVLAETRGALRKARAGLVGAPKTRPRSPPPLRHRGRTIQRAVEPDSSHMPDWLEAEVERRVAHVRQGEVCKGASIQTDPLATLSASPDEARTLLRLLADEAARARAAERDARVLRWLHVVVRNCARRSKAHLYL